MTLRIPSSEIPIITVPSSSHRIQRFIFPLVFSALVTGLGVAFGIHALIAGHDHVFGTSREVPWGILVTPYVFFACLATGACILSSLGQIFRVTPFVPLVKQTVYISLIAMAAGLFAIGLEVESPWRVPVFGIISANPLSNIWWKSAIYTLFLLLMIANYLLLLRGRADLARGFAIAALIAITCGNLNLNSDMALIGARGFWAENYMPLFFLTVSGLTACGAVALLVPINYWLYDRELSEELRSTLSAMCKMTLVLIGGILIFQLMKIMGGFSTKFTENPEALKLLVKGDYAINFWIAEIGLAVAMPLVLIIASRGGRQSTILGLAGFSLLAGIFVMFYDLIVVGQLIPHFQAYDLYGYPEFYSYRPSLHEFIMVAGAIAFFFTAYLLGEILFKNGR